MWQDSMRSLLALFFQLPLLTLSLCYIFAILALSHIYSLIIIFVTCDKCALLLLLQIEYNWLKTQMIAFLNNKAFVNWDICITLLDIIHLIDYNRVYTKFYMHWESKRFTWLTLLWHSLIMIWNLTCSISDVCLYLWPQLS